MESGSSGKIDPLNKLTSIYNKLPGNKKSELESELLLLVERFEEATHAWPTLPEKLTKKQMYIPGTDSVAHLKKHYGKFLTFYNKDLNEDILYRDYLWKHDPVFMRVVYDRLRYLHSINPSENPSPQEILKRRTDRVLKELSKFTSQQARQFQRLSSAIERRKRKKTNSVNINSPNFLLPENEN